MTTFGSPETDAFLLVLDETDFASVGALLGLRARPASPFDARLVDSYLEEEFPLGDSSADLLITTLPDIPSQ